MVLTNERDLGRAIKQKVEKLEIRGTLKDRVCRIRSIEERQWKACVSQIGMAVVFLQAMTKADGIPTSVSVLTGTPLLEKIAKILGISNAFSAILIAMAGGGIGILNQLRRYQMECLTEEEIVLRRKE